MDEIKPNSHKYKQEQAELAEKKRAQKVISGTARTKKNGLRKFTEAFISEDAGNVKSYVLTDVLVPAVKKLFFDIITNGADMIFYGGRGGKERRPGSAGYVSYSSRYDRDDRYHRQDTPRPTRFTYDDITLDNRQDAVEVLRRMDEIMAEYGNVKVADMFDLVGLTGEFTDHAYGWYDIRSARVESTRDGYKIRMPKAQPIRK